jgi:hypothetical protein
MRHVNTDEHVVCDIVLRDDGGATGASGESDRPGAKDDDRERRR